MRLRSYLFAGAASALPLLACPALAQQAPAQQQAAANTTNTGGIEQIVVTALRHSQNLMTAPVAIQAVTAEQIKNQGIRNLDDISLVTPGYIVADSSGYTQVYIRGIGNNIFVGADPSVATYTDDVPMIWGQMMNQFIDVSRVEVLQGAQGGLYGRNATGGVVNIITLQPTTDEFYGKAHLSYGSYNSLDVGAFVNVPITDTLAWTFAIDRQTHDPYYKNVGSTHPYSAANFPNGSYFGAPGFGPKGAGFSAQCGGGVFCTPTQSADIMNSGVDPKGMGNQDTYGADTKLMWQPTEDLKFTWAGDYYFKSDSNGNQNFVDLPGAAQDYLTENFASVGLPGAASAVSGACATGAPCFVPPAEQGITKKWQVAVSDNIMQQLHNWGTSLTAEWDVPFATLTSISAYRANHSVLQADLCACDPSSGTATVNIARQFYYQEIRAVSTGDGPFHWLGGATFLADHQTYDTLVSLLPPLINAHTAHGYDLVKNWTVYGQLGYDITPDLSLTASARWEHETNIFTATVPDPTSFCEVGTGGVGQPACVPLSSSAGTATEGLDKLIPSADLSYTLGDSGVIYARWARGVKSGGVNPVASPALFTSVGAPFSDGSEFGPEKVDTYEVGYKDSFMDNTVNFTGAIFYNKYNGLQISAHAEPAYQQAIILAIVNAGSAYTDGAQATVTWQPIDPLTLGFNVGYLNAMFSNFSYGDNVILYKTNLDHTEMVDAPKWQASFTADYDQPIDSRFDLVAHGVESYTGKQLGTQSLNAVPGAVYPGVYTGYLPSVPITLPNLYLPSYWLTNLRVGVKTSDDKYEFDVFATNVFDQKYYYYASSSGAGSLFGWGNPRVVGVELDIKY